MRRMTCRAIWDCSYAEGRFHSLDRAAAAAAAAGGTAGAAAGAGAGTGAGGHTARFPPTVFASAGVEFSRESSFQGRGHGEAISVLGRETPAPSPSAAELSSYAGAMAAEGLRVDIAAAAGAGGAGAGDLVGVNSPAMAPNPSTPGQGLTLAHFSAQPLPF
jgi:hypothetical protein